MKKEVKSKKGSACRCFFTSFFITLALFGFFAGLFWVDGSAAQNSFNSFMTSLNFMRSEPLHYRFQSALGEFELNLDGVNELAGRLRPIEEWSGSASEKLLGRLPFFAHDRYKAWQQYQREQEFYKNAGLV